MKHAMQILIALLAIVLLLGTAAGCTTPVENPVQEDTATQDVTSEEKTETAEVNLSKLPDKFWDRDFDVAGYSSGYTYGITSEEEATDQFSQKVFRRNSFLEEKYGFTIVYKGYPLLAGGEHALVDMVQQDAMTGKTEFELISANQGEASSLVGAGAFLMDLRSPYMKYLDLDADCWNQDCINNLSLKNHVFLLSGDMNVTEKGALMTMLYNREMIARQNLPVSLPDIVRAGEWTVEKYEEIMKNFSMIDGDGTVLCYGATYYNYFCAFITSCGLTVCEKDDSDLPVLVVNNMRTIDIVDKVLKVCSLPLYEQDKVVYYQRFSSGAPSTDKFKSGMAAFTAERTNVILSHYRDIDTFSLGYLPLPKFDVEQDRYLTYDYAYFTNKLIVPYMVEDTNFASFCLQAIGENSKDILYQYVEIQCKIRGTVDDEQYEMLSMALEHPVYDLGMVYDFGGIFQDLFCDSYDHLVSYAHYDAIAITGTNNFSTLYASYGPAATGKIEKFIASIEYMDSLD